MAETARDRLWIAALALARTRGTFTASDVLGAADLDDEHRPAAAEVLAVLRDYGFLERAADGEGWRAGSAVPATDPDPAGFDGSFTYLSAPVTRWTFASPVVREWVESRLEGRVLNLFAGETRLRHDGGEVVRNDVDEAIEADTRVDALEAATGFEPSSFDTVVIDPPLSVWRASGGGSPDTRGRRLEDQEAIARVRNQVVNLVRIGGRTITFGRRSSGMGSTRGFEMEELCLVNHTGDFPDTIAVVERRTRDVVEAPREAGAGQ